MWCRWCYQRRYPNLIVHALGLIVPVPRHLVLVYCYYWLMSQAHTVTAANRDTRTRAAEDDGVDVGQDADLPTVYNRWDAADAYSVYRTMSLHVYTYVCSYIPKYLTANDRPTGHSCFSGYGHKYQVLWHVICRCGSSKCLSSNSRTRQSELNSLLAASPRKSRCLYLKQSNLLNL